MSRIDGVALAVTTSRLQGVVRGMMNTLVRTGRSGILNTGRDFSCCLLTREHELLAMAEAIPIHTMGGPDLMSRAMVDLHPQLRRGDAFLHNSPYLGNSHAADFSLLVPVIDEDGEHHFTVFAKAHQADAGNAEPTTYMAGARDVYEEGALIFPCVRVQEDYRDVDDVIRMCEARIRVPEQWYGDHLALVGAARVGERRLLELAAEVGWDHLHDYTDQWFSYSEERMRAAIRRLPSGTVRAEATHDPFPGIPDGLTISVRADVDAEAETIAVDLTDNPDCVPCGLNLSEATARAAAMIGVFNSLDPEGEVPVNAGAFRRVSVALRENCVVGIPRHPTSTSVATTNLADRVANALQRAMADLGDGVGMAEFGPIIPPAWGVVSGDDPRQDRGRYVNQMCLPAVTCGAASPRADGWLLAGHVGAAGLSLRDSVELDELYQPIRILAQRLQPDTEGAGRHRGAPGAYVEFGPTLAPMELHYTSDGTVNPAQGANGGGPGAPATQHKRLRSGELVELEGSGGVVLEPGETVVAVCAGGGGYGAPAERDRDRVREDVAEGWITAERARASYGLVGD